DVPSAGAGPRGAARGDIHPPQRGALVVHGAREQYAPAVARPAWAAREAVRHERRAIGAVVVDRPDGDRAARPDLKERDASVAGVVGAAAAHGVVGEPDRGRRGAIRVEIE